MVNQLTLFIAIAASVFFISIVLMIFARRFQGVSRPINTRHGNSSAVSLEQAGGQRRVVQFRPSNRPTKPYNPFTKEELNLLHKTTLTAADLDVIAEKAPIVPTKPLSEEMDNADAKSVVSIELGILRYASQECSICLASYTADESVRVLTCEHVFHCECIDVWLTDRSARCPICKADNREALGLEFRKSDREQEEEEEDGERAPRRHHQIDILTPPPLAMM